jgi:hypothetical protein
MFDAKIVRAEPSSLPVAIFRMNCGMSMCVGQACTHGASVQNRHRFASAIAWSFVSAGL